MQTLYSPCLHFLVLLCIMRSAAGYFEFRLGAVLSSDGKTGEMSDARKGYELFFDEANAAKDEDFMFLGRSKTEGFRMKYNFVSEDDNSNKKVHSNKVRGLVENNKIHFLLGSHPEYAAKEMKISSKSDILNFQCCVGPDSFYEKKYKRVFGIHVSNRKYVLLTMIKLSLEKVKRLWIVSDGRNEFTKTTCEEAWRFKNITQEASENVDEFHYNVSDESDFNQAFFEDLAQRAKNSNVEAIIACLSKPDGKMLVDAFHDIKYPLKALFLTAGPTSPEWISNFSSPIRSDSLLSAAQWHKDMQYKDDFFKNGSHYVALYKKKFNGIEPSYVSASASATGLTLHLAIKRAFKNCDLSGTEGNVTKLLYNATAISCTGSKNSARTGYERIVSALRKTKNETFFGRVKFNRFQRNVENTPVTTQVFLDSDFTENLGSKSIKAVLPLTHFTTDKFRFPAKNYYEKTCMPGYYIGPDFLDRCLPCKCGTISYHTNSTDCDSCSIGEYMDEEGQNECHKCPIGTTTSQKGSTSRDDCTCEKGYYNIHSEEGDVCKECPHGATCDGGTRCPYPKKGFWMNETWPDNAYPCDPSGTCLGNYTCRKGNSGRICAECEDGYYSIIQQCYKCQHELLVMFFSVLIVGVWYFINVSISRRLISLEMLLNWTQLANIIGDVNLNWPPRLMEVFGYASILDFDVDALEPSCLMRGWGFRENLIVQLCLPLFMTFLAVVGYFLSRLIFHQMKQKSFRLNGYKKKVLSLFVHIPHSKEELSTNWDRTVSNFFSFVDVTYITLTKYCFDTFKCQDIAGEKVLRASPTILCNTAQHNEIVVLGIIGCFVYVVGYVVYTIWTLLYLWENEAFHKEKYVSRYGFMYQNFEVRCFLFPICILCQKLLFVIVLVFLNKPAFQIGALVMIVIASLMIHITTTPYLDAKTDVLVTFLLLALMFEAFGGLIFYNNSMSDGDRALLEWIIIVAVFLLLTVFLVIFLIDIGNKYYIYRTNKTPRNFADQADSQGLYSCGKETQSGEGTSEASIMFSWSSKEDRREKEMHEGADTFKPQYVYMCKQIDPSFTQDWDKLTKLYSGFVSRHSSASYWSLRPSAKFWRRLVDQLPEIVDFIAVADEETLSSFNSITQRLYQDFFLANQVIPLPLMKLLNKRDRASMAHWLSVASREEKQLFLDTIGRMLEIVGYQTISDSMYAKIQQKGQNVFLMDRIMQGYFTGMHRRRWELTLGSSLHDPPSMVNMQQLKALERSRRKHDIGSPSNQRKSKKHEESLTDETSVFCLDSTRLKVDTIFETLPTYWSEDLSKIRPVAYDDLVRTFSDSCSSAQTSSVQSSSLNNSSSYTEKHES
eukprot:g6272.t1